MPGLGVDDMVERGQSWSELGFDLKEYGFRKGSGCLGPPLAL